MPTVTFMWFSKDDGDRVFGIAGELTRIAENHNVAFHVRTEEEDPDADTEEKRDAPPDPVRLVEGLTLPKDVVDRLRQVAKAAKLHIYVHPAARLHPEEHPEKGAPLKSRSVSFVNSSIA